MPLIRPRLNDFHNLPFTQEEVDFAIPFIDEDIPLYIDPFLLWKSPSQQDNSLHTALVSAFNHLGFSYLKGEKDYAIQTLIKLSECNEVGFGNSKNRKGKRIGAKLAETILKLWTKIPQIQARGFSHLEEIQLCVEGISKDRISDITASLIKSFLIDFTISESKKVGIPLHQEVEIEVYNFRKNNFCIEKVQLPINPDTGLPVLFVPKRWLKFIPWINFDDYFDNYFLKEVDDSVRDSATLLDYNRNNYGAIEAYIALKERQQNDCKNDPLFKAIPIGSATRKLVEVLKLPTGKEKGIDKIYEETIGQLMASLLYPKLDFADTQARTDSGVHIRDLIFYNNHSDEFLAEIYKTYNCTQIVMELKNVKNVETEHVNQLHRYLKDSFGGFGIIITRNEPGKNVVKNIVDLWSAQRKCILVLTDEDIRLMVTVFRSKQRSPLDVLKKKFVEFNRQCPS
jgi:hypothetical protein